MSACASCGIQVPGGGELCPHHHVVYGDDWCRNNRIMCDFFHRGVEPARLGERDREEEFWAAAV